MGDGSAAGMGTAALAVQLATAKPRNAKPSTACGVGQGFHGMGAEFSSTKVGIAPRNAVNVSAPYCERSGELLDVDSIDTPSNGLACLWVDLYQAP